MNLAEFRKKYTTKEILDFSAKEKWELLDQDILNKLCEDKVKYVDMNWNVMIDYGDIRIKEIISLAPQWLNKMYMAARKNPYIVHYAGPEKPWHKPDIDFACNFWKYAKETPYYEIILFRMMNTVAGWKQRRKHKTLIGGGIQCIIDHGLVYTIKYLPKRLSRDE